MPNDTLTRLTTYLKSEQRLIISCFVNFIKNNPQSFCPTLGVHYILLEPTLSILFSSFNSLINIAILDDFNPTTLISSAVVIVGSLVIAFNTFICEGSNYTITIAFVNFYSTLCSTLCSFDKYLFTMLYLLLQHIFKLKKGLIFGLKPYISPIII